MMLWVLLVAAQVMTAISRANHALGNTQEPNVIAKNLRVNTLDLIQTLYWDPAETTLAKMDGDDRQRYTVYYAEIISDEEGAVSLDDLSWTKVENCVDVITTVCVIEVFFIPISVYALWVTTNHRNITDMTLEDSRPDVMQYSTYTELIYETLEFSAPRFQAHRDKNKVDIQFEQIQMDWWKNRTMGEIVKSSIGEWPTNVIAYYSCAEVNQNICTRKHGEVNYKSDSTKFYHVKLVTTVEDSATLCIDVHVHVDEGVGDFLSNQTTMCFPPDLPLGITPFVVSSGALLLLLIIFSYCFCKRNGKKICWRALKIQHIEIPNTVDEILRERPNGMTFNQLVMDEAAEEFQPLSIGSNSFHNDVVAVYPSDDVTSVNGEQVLQPMEESYDTASIDTQEVESQQAYLKITDLRNFSSYENDVSTPVTYSEVLSTETESGTSSAGYITLSEHVNTCVNNNNFNMDGTKRSHVCSEDCGYVEKENFPLRNPCASP